MRRLHMPVQCFRWALEVPYTRKHVMECSLEDQEQSVKGPRAWLTDKGRRKRKLRTKEEELNFMVWNRPKVVIDWARKVGIPRELEKRLRDEGTHER